MIIITIIMVIVIVKGIAKLCEKFLLVAEKCGWPAAWSATSAKLSPALA